MKVITVKTAYKLADNKEIAIVADKVISFYAHSGSYDSYENIKAIIEYVGGGEIQTLYVQNTFDDIMKQMSSE